MKKLILVGLLTGLAAANSVAHDWGISIRIGGLRVALPAPPIVVAPAPVIIPAPPVVVAPPAPVVVHRPVIHHPVVIHHPPVYRPPVIVHAPFCPPPRPVVVYARPWAHY